MEEENKKTTRPYHDSLSEVFMTTKEIAKLWNQKVMDKDGKERVRVPHKNDDIQLWAPDEISGRFKRILEGWGLSEYIDCYRSDKFFDLKQNMESLESDLKKLELMQEDIERLLKKNVVHEFNGLRKKLEEDFTQLREFFKTHCSFKGDYIFNKDAFGIDEEENEGVDGEEDNGYDDPLYHIFRLYDKTEKLTKENIEAVADDLVNLTPIFQSILSLEKFNLCITEKKQELDGYSSFYAKRYRDMREGNKYRIEKKLCQHFLYKNEKWRISEILFECDIPKGQREEAHHIYRIMLLITDYVVEKYTYLLEHIEKTRIIERKILYDNNKFTNISIYSIIDHYRKDFVYKIDKYMLDEINFVKDRIGADYVLKIIRKNLDSCISNAHYMSDDEKNKIYNEIYDEMDELRREGFLYYKLLRLMHECKLITTEDVESYFKITKKNGLHDSIVQVEQKNLELKIMGITQLREQIQLVIKDEEVKETVG